MTKWYKEGFKEGQSGMPCDPPMQPGSRSYEDYLAGFKDGERQSEQDCEL